MKDNRVRIFVSSPADVDHERAIVKDVIERLAQEYLPYFPIQAVLWEDEALTADRTFQAGLTQPEDCDIVLLILWTRLGSPLPQEPYHGMTGTEWEFVSAVNASFDGGMPEVLVYKKTAPKLVDITNPGVAREAVEDRRRLEEFFRGHFFNDDNTFRRAFRSFDSDSAFRELVEVQLRKLLNRRISSERRAVSGELTWRGSPFRPNRPFESSDERIFTGREREVWDLITRLDQCAAGYGLLLLTGPSGSGKTSLLRAGLMPRLSRPFQFEEVATVRCCLIDPRADGPTPIQALATRLCAEDCLGDALGHFGLRGDGLTRLLIGEPAVAADQIITAASAQARRTDPNASARLALIVDPLDELFPAGLDRGHTGGETDDEALRLFATALHALAVSNGVWVIVAMRSDALHHLPRLAPLIDQLGASAWVSLDPPAPARLRQIVEIPARIAGIDFDARDEIQGRALVELIEADAADLRLWTPPLQGVLDAAYRAAAAHGGVKAGGEVRVSARYYREQGGLAGHMVTEAEQVWKRADEGTRGALPMLCRALIALENTDGSRPVARQGDLSVLERNPDCRRLLAALTEARLVITEGLRDAALQAHCETPDFRILSLLPSVWRQSREEWRARWGSRQHGAADAEPPPDSTPSAESDDPDRAWREYRPAVSFCHPALLTDWAPVRDWLQQPQNRKLLQLRTQLTRQAQLWKRTNCNREYLLHQSGFDTATELAARYSAEMEPLERELFDQSGAYLAFVRRRNRIVRGFGILLVALLVASTIAAILAVSAFTKAQVNLHLSRLKEAELDIVGGNTPRAVIQALNAGPDLPYVAVQILSKAFTGNRLVAMARSLGPYPDDPRIPGLSADGSRLATILPDGGPRLWRLDKGRFTPERDLNAGGIALHSLIIGAADDAVFGIGEGGIWRLPAAADEPPTYPCGTRSDPRFTLDASRRYLAIARNTANGGNGVCVVDLTMPGRVLYQHMREDEDEGEIRGLSFSHDSRALLTATAKGRTHLVDLHAGKLVLSLPADGPLGRPFNNAVFDAAGERIAIAAVDERVRLYQRDGTPIGELSDSDISGRRFKIHKSAVRDVCFAPDGQFLVAVDDQGQVVRWALDGSRQAVVLGNHDLSADEVEIIQPVDRAGDTGETLVLTASLDQTARLWSLQTGKQVAVMGHDAAVSAARFSDGGERVMTFSARDGSVRLWSVTPVSSLAFRLQHPDHVWNLDTAAAPPELTPDGDALLLATAGYDGGVRVWRYRRGVDGAAPQLIASFEDHRGRVPQIRFSPSARLLASAGYDGTAQVHSLVSDRSCVLPVDPGSGTGQVSNVLFDPDERWLLTTSTNPEQPVRLYSLDACAPIDVDPALRDGDAPVGAATLLSRPDGILVATGDDSGILRLLQLAPGQVWQRRCVLPIDDGAIGDIALSPDGRTIGVTGSGGRAALVDIGEQGCRIETDLQGHGGRVYSIAFSPDSRQVLTASLDKTARLWDRDGTPRAVLVGHEDRIYKASFSPGDGRWMQTASRDGSIRLWKRPAAKESGFRTLSTYLPLQADLGGVADAMFSPDGHYLAGAYWENAALLWRLWVEGDQVPRQLIDHWGEDRARLALIQDAYRFRQDNQIVDQKSAEEQ